MPILLQSDLKKIKYKSMADFCKQIDKYTDFNDKMEFATRYLLSHGMPGQQTDYTIEEAMHIARMKLIDASVKQKKEASKRTQPKDSYVETHPEAVNPKAKNFKEDYKNQAFMKDPAGYLQEKAFELGNSIQGNDNEISEEQTLKNNCIRLSHELEGKSAKVFEIESKRQNSIDIKIRLETAFGGRKGLEDAYKATKPGTFSKLFGTSSVASKNLDEVYNAFNNPNHALYNDMNSLEKAANEYLVHKFPGWKPGNPYPTKEQLDKLDSTSKGRSDFSINILKSIEEQREMEESFRTIANGCKDKDLDEAMKEAEEQIKAEEIEEENKFQEQLKKELAEADRANGFNVPENEEMNLDRDVILENRGEDDVDREEIDAFENKDDPNKEDEKVEDSASSIEEEESSYDDDMPVKFYKYTKEEREMKAMHAEEDDGSVDFNVEEQRFQARRRGEDIEDTEEFEDSDDIEMSR